MRYNTIFFDLDGTLTDPGIGITNSVMYALKHFGIDAKREELYKFIGPPLTDSFEEFYGFDEKEALLGVKYFREYFTDKGIFENRVYEGIYEVLENLRQSGKMLCVATSKPCDFTMRILDKYDLRKYFDYVSASSMDEKDSTKSVIIKNALGMSGADERTTLMVGDRKFDILGAKDNNMKSAGVLYGYGSLEELKSAGADYLISDVRELIQFCEEVES